MKGKGVLLIDFLDMFITKETIQNDLNEIDIQKLSDKKMSFIKLEKMRVQVKISLSKQ